MNKEDSFKLLDAYWQSGGNFIDTSNNYQDEQSEMWIGEWMAKHNNREQLVIATKFTSDYRSHAIGKGKAPNFMGNTRKSLYMSIRASLKKLQTEYVDILYMHYWDYTTSIKELMDSLHMLVEEGKVLYLGVSDTPAWIVASANTYASYHGKTPFSIYQGRWNVMIRDFEREIIPMARMFGMALAPWDVLGGGKLQSKQALEERLKNNEQLRPLRSEGKNGGQTDFEEEMSLALYKVAQEHGLESVTAIALAYVMSKAGQVFPIVGGRKVEHLHDNIQSLKITLTPEQIGHIESVRPFHVGFPNTFIGDDPFVTGYNVRLDRAAKMSFPHLRK